MDSMKKQISYLIGCLDKLNLKKGSQLLNLGCDAEFISTEFSQRGFRIITGDIEKLDFQNRSFDVVVVMGLIEYLKWDRWALQEMQRVLKPGGHLIVSVPNGNSLFCWTNLKQLASLTRQEIKNIIGRTLAKFFGSRIILWLKSYIIGGKASNVPKKRLYIPSRLRNTLTGLGFDIVGSLSGSNYVAFCRKKECSSELNQRQVFKDIKNRIKIFELEKRKYFSKRKTWIRKNPEYRSLNPESLDSHISFGKNALVLSPHPDDELIGCGGTLIKMLKNGSKLFVLHMSNGGHIGVLRDSPEHIREKVRFEEAKIVAKELGFNELILWHEKDPYLKCSQDNIRKLTGILNRLYPKVIFVPFINDLQPDHVVANKILAESLRRCTLNLFEVNVLSYEVWSVLPSNFFCAIDDQFDKKAEVLLRYRTGMKDTDYVHHCESQNAYHAYTLLGKKGFVEAFLGLDASKYINLVLGCK
jgi:LmbE family N-acetylglucosaminyl deacetylase/SAM-dependent methyltransferase